MVGKVHINVVINVVMCRKGWIGIGVSPLSVHLDLPLLVLSGVVLQIFITSGGRYVRSEAFVMMALYFVFLAAHFFDFQLNFP